MKGGAIAQLFVAATIAFVAGWLVKGSQPCESIAPIGRELTVEVGSEGFDIDEFDEFDSFDDSSGYPTGTYAVEEFATGYDRFGFVSPPPPEKVEKVPDEVPIKASVPVILDPEKRKKGAAASRDIFRSFLEDREQQLGSRSSDFRDRFDCGDKECSKDVPEQVQVDYDRMQVQQQAVGVMEENFGSDGSSFTFTDEQAEE